jgi:single-strand DNA-binding protein
MFNLAILTGRLTANPELKTTTNGISVCTFGIAVDRAYKKGEEKQTDFLNVVCWRSTAEFVSKYFSKGNLIGIEGSIQTRKYTDKDGNNRTAFEIVANNVHFVESKRSVDVNVSPDPLPDFANKVNELNNANSSSGDMFADVLDNSGDLPF